MKIMLTAYAGTFVSLLIADALYLGVIARGFYKEQLGALLLPQPNFVIAALFYLFFAAAVVVLAVSPALKAEALSTALLLGAVLGFAAYGTYDFTNLATLRNWPVLVTAVDIAWGTFVTAFAAACGFWAASLAGAKLPG